MSKPIYEYLIVVVDETDVEGYYLLTDSQMAKADARQEKDGDYWGYISKRKGCRHFSSVGDLAAFMAANAVTLQGEFGCTTY